MEQFPYALAQAMACGIPSLATASGAIPDMIGEPAMLCREGDLNAIEERIKALHGNPEERRAIGSRQREYVVQNFTNTIIAGRFVQFIEPLIQQQRTIVNYSNLAVKKTGTAFIEEQLPRHQSGRIIAQLSDMAITECSNRPKRFLDWFHEAPTSLKKVQLVCFTAKSDEDMEAKMAWLPTTRHKILFFRVTSLWNLAKSYRCLRRTDLILCHDPHYFWWLVILNRLGLFPAHGKRVFSVFFRGNSFMKRLKLLRNAPPEFQPYFISREQIAGLERAGFPHGRIRFADWKIDTEWFRPGTARTGGYILCPGNIHRDEKLILKLARSTPLKIVRVGRMGCLRTIYGHSGVAEDRLELVYNADHLEYLRLLQNAALVILPIEPCHEPAGLTAALEAMSCCTPMLANESIGVSSLIREGYGLDPISNSTQEEWLRRITEALDGGLYSPERLERARKFVLDRHAILPDGKDWLAFV